MGRDKALLPVGGVPMAERVARACEAAGASAVALGGELPGLGALGRTVLADEQADTGPLAGIAVALAWSPSPWCLIVSCDLVAPDPAVLRSVADARTGPGLADPPVLAVVPVVDGVPQVLHALWAREALPAVRGALAAGERAVRAVLTSVPTRELRGLPGAALADADRPEDLPAG
jgi:molybdopterin-guanine dinucleotide biosynthesis protein A